MRAFLPKEQQKKFINKILSKISIKDAASLCNISERTIRDWRRGLFSMDFNIIQRLCKKTNTLLPKNLKTKDRYWYTSTGSSAGGIAVWKKYGKIGGNPEYRKKKWYEWWEKEGKFRPYPFINAPIPIKKPNYSKNLAEFIGIVMGDGGITKRQITITLHCKNDKEYGKFVVRLIKNLFDVPVSTYYRKRDLAISYVVSRTELVKFCTEKLGLKIGNKIKQQIDIPNWIKKNKQYSIACVRGLIDTDGCMFNHKYKIKRKWYSYKKLTFTSYSKPLRESVFNILKNNGLNPRSAQDKDIRIDSIENMRKYFRIFNSHNPKHLKRYFR